MIEWLTHSKNEWLKLRPYLAFILLGYLLLALILSYYLRQQFTGFQSALEKYTLVYEDPNAFHFIITRSLTTMIPLLGIFILMTAFLLFGRESLEERWLQFKLLPIDSRKLVTVKLLLAFLLTALFSVGLLCMIWAHLNLISDRFQDQFHGYARPALAGLIGHYLFFPLKVLLFQALVFHLLRKKLWIAFLAGVIGPFLILFSMNPYNFHYRIGQSDYGLFLAISLIYSLALYTILLKLIKR